MSQKRKLITSALPYVNNVPHLGNIIGCVLSADVYARFCRQRGYETLYICGTDEYGTATENRAREEGLTPREICDKYNAIHTEIYKTFNIAFDTFGRTSTEKQTEIAQGIFHKLDEAGLIQEHTEERVYCEVDVMFLADRFVEGTCPKCGYEDARGDQCDRCGTLLDPEKLLTPRCKICGTPPVRKPTTHLFLDLAALQPKLEAWFEKASKAGNWTRNAIQTTRAWLDQGLQARPITRDLKWGIPVPKPGFEDKVFYVWFDAPIGYISITAHAFEDWQSWWLDPDNVDLYQFMAKDNIPFHTVIFPASLLGTGQNWSMLHHINSTEYLNYEETKFSKSRSVGVFGTDVVETGIPIDLWRFYLLRVRPESNDSKFNWEEFYERVNKEFIDNLGNLVHRGSTYAVKNFDGEIRDFEPDDSHRAFTDEVTAEWARFTEALEAVRLRDALTILLRIGDIGNKFFQEQAPFKRIKEDRDAAHTTVSLLLYLVRHIATGLYPYMPETAERIFATLNLKPETWTDTPAFTGLDGHKIGKPDLLFKKLDLKDAAKFRKKFSGEQANFGILKVAVGQVVEVADHPNSNQNFLLKVDIGEDQPRQIVAGLKKHYGADDIQDRKVLVMANLKAAELQGKLSEGMLLAAVKGKKTELLHPGDAPVGQLLEAAKQTVIHEEISIDIVKSAPLKVTDSQVTFDDEPLLLDGKTIKTSVIANGKVR
ncbi:methionine--tRNA ligase [Acanthopleuribacter pedis]|uniref:Methionine--tRNA ligase n=1 Tax=Acanthopleuribacter pedis TaxID=442870 RepID=A0A8J7QHN6_9BACT|nr:methionine--tRNA ligase [Acanthopleuribacter pedis]MBO1322650.1 methionine--tRNA ligase [Acanthopleuribacter pedis]